MLTVKTQNDTSYVFEKLIIYIVIVFFKQKQRNLESLFLRWSKHIVDLNIYIYVWMTKQYIFLKYKLQTAK